MGPLLFLIFINDITENLTSVVHLYADDTNLLHPTKNVTESILEVNKDLAKVKTWCDKWGVTMNVDKTKVVLFSRKTNLSSLE